MSAPRLRPWDVVLGAVTVLMFSTALALLAHGSSSRTLALFRRHEPTLPVGVGSVSLQEAYSRWRPGGTLFVDARSPLEYESGHVPGALLLHPSQLSPMAPEKLAVLAGAGRVVVYCSGPGCGASRRVAEQLSALELADLRVMPEGYPAWERAGFPVEKGR